MRLSPFELDGLLLVEPERRSDTRGFFARTFCEEEMTAAGMHSRFPQCSISFNRERGTLRGMHFQSTPHPEPKIVRCTRGAIFDVAVDLRPSSPTFCKWAALELNDENRLALYIPPGFAHGFQTLTAGAEVLYMMGEYYHPELARGVRWDDPAFGIAWPIGAPILSERDATYPDLEKGTFSL